MTDIDPQHVSNICCLLTQQKVHSTICPHTHTWISLDHLPSLPILRKSHWLCDTSTSSHSPASQEYFHSINKTRANHVTYCGLMNSV